MKMQSAFPASIESPPVVEAGPYHRVWQKVSAEVKDCIGLFIPPNVILYDDAFTDIKGAIRYTYTKSGFEQDVLIYDSSGLGSPEDYGLNPATTLLEMYSEFHEAPTPQKTTQLTPDSLSDER